MSLRYSYILRGAKISASSEIRNVLQEIFLSNLHGGYGSNVAGMAEGVGLIWRFLQLGPLYNLEEGIEKVSRSGRVVMSVRATSGLRVFECKSVLSDWLTKYKGVVIG